MSANEPVSENRPSETASIEETSLRSIRYFVFSLWNSEILRVAFVIPQLNSIFIYYGSS